MKIGKLIELLARRVGGNFPGVVFELLLWGLGHSGVRVVFVGLRGWFFRSENFIGKLGGLAWFLSRKFGVIGGRKRLFVWRDDFFRLRRCGDLFLQRHCGRRRLLFIQRDEGRRLRHQRQGRKPRCYHTSYSPHTLSNPLPS